MSDRINQLMERMTPRERGEVEAFAAFVIARRSLKEPQILTDDISISELMELVTKSGSFEWLDAEEENIYSAGNGEAVQWPTA